MAIGSPTTYLRSSHHTELNYQECVVISASVTRSGASPRAVIEHRRRQWVDDLTVCNIEWFAML